MLCLKQKIDVYTICWNEEKFLPYFLNYYANIVKVDAIYVYDNQSSDDSQKIISTFNNTTIVEYDTGGHINDDVYLKIKNEEWKKYSTDADWIIVVDIDEILYSPNGLRNTLEQLTNEEQDVIKMEGYQMYSLEFPDTITYNPLEVSTNGVRDVEFDKCSIFNPRTLDEIGYCPGCHKSIPKLKRKGKRVNICDYSGIRMFHYKFVFGEEFLKIRYMEYQKRLSDINKKFGWGKHYQKIKEMYEKYRQIGNDSCSVV